MSHRRLVEEYLLTVSSRERQANESNCNFTFNMNNHSRAGKPCASHVDYVQIPNMFDNVREGLNTIVLTIDEQTFTITIPPGYYTTNDLVQFFNTYDLGNPGYTIQGQVVDDKFRIIVTKLQDTYLSVDNIGPKTMPVTNYWADLDNLFDGNANAPITSIQNTPSATVNPSSSSYTFAQFVPTAPALVGPTLPNDIVLGSNFIVINFVGELDSISPGSGVLDVARLYDPQIDKIDPTAAWNVLITVLQNTPNVYLVNRYSSTPPGILFGASSNFVAGGNPLNVAFNPNSPFPLGSLELFSIIVYDMNISNNQNLDDYPSLIAFSYTIPPVVNCSLTSSTAGEYMDVLTHNLGITPLQESIPLPLNPNLPLSFVVLGGDPVNEAGVTNVLITSFALAESNGVGTSHNQFERRGGDKRDIDLLSVVSLADTLRGSYTHHQPMNADSTMLRYRHRKDLHRLDFQLRDEAGRILALPDNYNWFMTMRMIHET